MSVDEHVCVCRGSTKHGLEGAWHDGPDSAVVEVKSLPASFLQAPTSYAKIPIPSSWYDIIDIEFKFRTEDLNGTILYAPGSNKVDFFRIYLENGKLYTKWNLGSG